MKQVDRLSLPGGWELKKLGEICAVQRGLTYGGNDTVDFSENIVLRATNINLESRSLDFSELKYLRNDFVINEKYKVLKGSLLICFSSGSKSHLGKIALVDDEYEYAFGGFIGQINPSSKVLSSYLFYAMISENYKTYISELTDGVNINNLKIKDLQAYEIPLPPLPEQHHIVAILDKCFAAIDKAKANAEQNLKNAKELFESYLQGVFEKRGEGWEEKQFDEVCVLQRGFDLPTRLRLKGKYPLVSSNGITDKVNQCKVKSPGVVTGRSGTIGKVHFIEEDFWPLNTALYIKDFHGNDERCIYYFLLQFDLGKYSSGAGVPTLNRNNVHSEKVWFPQSVSEQQNIVRQLDTMHAETQKLEAIYQKKLDNLEELKKSILQKAFAGELSNATIKDIEI